MKLPKPVAGFLSSLYDSVVCRPARAARQGRAEKVPRLTGSGFGVVIPHYNRGASIHRPLFNLLDHPAVEEVVVFDDGSSPEEFHLLCKNISVLNPDRRVLVERRDENRGALATKIDAVSVAKSEWVLVLDSDNTAFRGYLNVLQSVANRDPDVIYCSPFAFPYFSFRPFAGKAFSFEECCVLTRGGELRRVFIINDGNYLVHRETYLQRIGPLAGLACNAADVMVANYKWLSDGGRLHVLDRGAYHHRNDVSSFWMRTAGESRARVLEIFRLFEQGISWHSGGDKKIYPSVS